MKKVYIVDLGSCYTSVYGNGLMFREPTRILIKNKREPELVAAGAECRGYKEDGTEPISLINPVLNGTIVNPHAASMMLGYFLSDIIPQGLFSRYEIVVPVSSGLTIIERDAYEEAFLKAGYKNITLIETIRGLTPFTDPSGQAVIVIGGGTTEIGVISKNGIVNACAIDIGGQRLNKMIADCILENYEMEISDAVAERVKIKLGSLYENDESIMEIIADDIFDKRTKTIEISAKNIKKPVMEFYNTILDVAKSFLTTVPLQILPDINMRGVYLAGGGSQAPGLADFMRENLRMPVHTDSEPELTVLKGLYKMYEKS